MSNQQPGNYSAMPPPPSLTGEATPVNFNDALSKARAIAEKLKSQNAGAVPSPPAAGNIFAYFFFSLWMIVVMVINVEFYDD